jgi:phosphate transport system protein
MRTHTNQEYEAELQQIKDRLLSMGGRCEQMVDMAVEAYHERNAKLTDEIVKADRQMNADELDVDEMAVRVLALRNPVGRDLRFIVTAVKVVIDLERIGDEAVNLAERIGEMISELDVVPPSSEIPEMARLANIMLHDALDAFVAEDAERALEIRKQDDAVDEIYGRTLRSSMEYMAGHPERIRAGMRVCSCAKYIERIADHATNIAEMVVFMVRGEDVRHRFAV